MRTCLQPLKFPEGNYYPKWEGRPPRLLAYMDESIEIFPARDGAPARHLLAPMVLARLVQLAAVGPEDVVLDVGCATGYSTAVLAGLGGKVIGLEPEPELADAA